MVLFNVMPYYFSSISVVSLNRVPALSDCLEIPFIFVGVWASFSGTAYFSVAERNSGFLFHIESFFYFHAEPCFLLRRWSQINQDPVVTFVGYVLF